MIQSRCSNLVTYDTLIDFNLSHSNVDENVLGASLSILISCR